MDALRPRLVQLTVQLRDALSRRDTMRRLREHGGSSSRRSCLPWLMVTTSAKPVALGGVTEMTTSEVRLIAERIEARLASIAEHEAAIRSDFIAATGDIVITMDADGSTDPQEIPAFIGTLVSGADFAKGARFL